MQIDISMKMEMSKKVHQQGKMLRLCSSSSFMSDSLHIPQPQWISEVLRHGATGRRVFFHLHTIVRHQPGWTFHHPIKAVVSLVLDLCRGSRQKWSWRGGCGWRGSGSGYCSLLLWISNSGTLVTWAFCTPPAGFEKSKGWEALRNLIYVVCSKLCF